ncbi:hotdog domain-containing protein, partial [Acinetobacter baumannii]
PRDVNGNGDIFGGWLVTQMDLAGTISAQKRAQGRVATVAIDSMVFLRPIKVGDIVACYTDILEIGRSSIKISI